MGSASGTVVGVRSALQRRAAERSRRDVQRVGRCPRRIGSPGRITLSTALDVLRGLGSVVDRVFVDGAPCLAGEMERGGAHRMGVQSLAPTNAEARQRQPRRQAIAPVPQSRPVMPYVPRERNGVPGDPFRLVSLSVIRTSAPASRSRAKKSASLVACPAASAARLRSTARATATDRPLARNGAARSRTSPPGSQVWQGEVSGKLPSALARGDGLPLVQERTAAALVTLALSLCVPVLLAIPPDLAPGPPGSCHDRRFRAAVPVGCRAPVL